MDETVLLNWIGMLIGNIYGRWITMKEVFEEYGKMIIAVVSSVLLVGFAAAFLTTGQAFEMIFAFSQSIC